MSLSTSDRLVLVETLGRGQNVETAESRLDLVKHLLSHGGLGGGSGYGEDEHLSALDDVIDFSRKQQQAIAVERVGWEQPVPTDIFHTGVELIAMERLRQIQKEGWTAEHDDAHGQGELAAAAASYALSAAGFRDVEQFEATFADGKDRPVWPFHMDWWKPGHPGEIATRIRTLSKAGALVGAEIDRLTRIEAARMEEEARRESEDEP